MPIPIDGNVAEIGAVVCGLVAMLVKPVMRRWAGRKPCFTQRDLLVDFLNGATTPAFLLLVGSVVSSKILEEALNTAKTSMALAGVMGLIFIVREIITDVQAATVPSAKSS